MAGNVAEQLETLTGFTPEEQAELEQGDQSSANANNSQEDAGAAEAQQSEAEEKPTQRQKPPPGFVEKEALSETRSELKRVRDRAEKLEAMWNQVLEKQAAAAAPKPEQALANEYANIPRYEDDPVGHLTARLAIAEQRLQTNEQMTAQEKQALQQQTQAQRQTQEMLNRYTASVRNFSREHKDFGQAYQYLTDTLDAELQARGYDDPVERSNLLQYEEGVMVARAMAAGKDPAEIVYNYAKHRGFKPANGATTESKLAQIAAGQQAAQSLSGKGNAGEPGTTTINQLLRMYDEDPEAADREFAKMAKAGKLG